MTDERFRNVFGRLDGGPMELDAEFDVQLRERLIAALSVEEAVESDEAPTQTVIDMGETWNRQPQRGLWGRRVLVLAAAATAVVALAVVVTARGSDDAEVVPPVGSTRASTPEASVAVVVPPVPAGWSDAPVGECDATVEAIGPDGVGWGGGLGLNRWDGEWTRFTHEDGLVAGPGFDSEPPFPDESEAAEDPCAYWEAPEVTNVRVGPDGTVWLTTGAGISTFDGEEFTLVAGYPGGAAPETFSGYFWVDANGDVWFPTFERIETPSDQIDPETGEPFIDPETGEPAVVVAENLTGLARLDGDSWIEFPLAAASENPSVGGPLVADDGSAYWRTADAIYELVGGTWTRIDSELLGGGRFGQMVAAGPDGSLWVSVTDEVGIDPETGNERLTALAQWDGEAWIMHTEEIPFEFWQPIVAPDGTFWAGIAPSEEEAFGGLVSYDGVNWTVHPKEGIDSDCAPVFLTSDGTAIWVSGPDCNPVRYNPSG